METGSESGGLVRAMRAGELLVQEYETRARLGLAAGLAVAERIRALLAEKSLVSVVFAAAPSQNEFLAALGAQDLPWHRVVAFHLDEYVGLEDSAPQRFGNFLRDRLFGVVPFAAVHYLDGNAPDPGVECRRYASLLERFPLDVACIGIGENGHIAFNDPAVADFADPRAVKVVSLDERSRAQQVHDGAFTRLEEVPTDALTLTIPAITRADWVYCMVPATSKAEAVRAAVEGPISTECPASILRRHPHAVLYVDRDSARLLTADGAPRL